MITDAILTEKGLVSAPKLADTVLFWTAAMGWRGVAVGSTAEGLRALGGDDGADDEGEKSGR